MKGYLVRVGIDQAFGRWNAPVDPATNDFVYVPIPQGAPNRPGLSTPYEIVVPALEAFAAAHPSATPERVKLPTRLSGRNMHLDPDFRHLTYGDNGTRRGRGLAGLGRGDVVGFYAGLRPVIPCGHRLVYALIGLYRVAEVVRVESVEESRWSENAHTRRLVHEGSDVVVRALPEGSGRLRTCIPIGEYRAGAYRVTAEILEAWGGLSCRDGYIQRSAVPPRFLDAERFLAWFEGLGGELIRSNNP